MHLPQIVALPKVAEDLAEPGRAAHPAPEGEGFLSIFSCGAAGGGAEPSGSEPPVAARPAAVAFADFAQAPGLEAPGTGATAMAALLPRADPVSEPIDLGQLPPEEARALVPDAGADTDGQSKSGGAAELPTEAAMEIDFPDGWLLPGIPVPVTTPGGGNTAGVNTAGANTGKADTGKADTGEAGKGQTPGVLAQANVPVRPSPNKPDGGMLTSKGADAGGMTVPEHAAAIRRAVNTLAPGGERPVQSMPTAVPDFSGSAARGGAFAIDPRMTMTDPGMRGPAQLAGGTPQEASSLPDGQSRPEGESGNRGAEVRPPDLAAPTVPTATRRDQAGAGNSVGTGQTAPVATGMQMPAGLQDLPPEVRGPRAEARSAAEAAVPASKGAPQAEMPTMQPNAAAAVSAGSGTEARGADVGRGSGASGSSGAGEGLFNADPALSETAFGDSRATARGTSAGSLPIFQSPGTPRQVALQIAEVVRASGERAVELKLQPEELGRVHLSMSQDATGTLTVSLNVERAETLDLLRRNIDLLGADLRELGYESIDFSFQGDGAGAQQEARRERSDGPGALDADAENTSGNLPQSGVRGAQASGDGIDIRL